MTKIFITEWVIIKKKKKKKGKRKEKENEWHEANRQSAKFPMKKGSQIISNRDIYVPMRVLIKPQILVNI